MSFSKSSILIIDDDASIGFLTKARLSKHDNYDVVVAHNGLEGIKLVNNKKPDLILLDWEMPGINGIEVLKQIKKQSETSNIPVVMLTGKNLVGEIEDAFKAGADAYITKPIDLKKLSEKVKSFLN
ncbi:MAG: response regulator [Pseudomonadota bacterium]